MLMDYSNNAEANGMRNAYSDDYNHGLTKAELIAAMALQGLLANPVIATPQVIHGETGGEAELMDILAVRAAYLAQSLLEELTL
jgi:hypothetical protein